MYDNFNEGIVAGIIGIALIGILCIGVGGICASYNNASHARLGTLGNPCFANKTCRTEKPMKCQDDGSEAGICVKQ
jgi:hypothetical protein